MKKQISLFIFIDALGWEILRNRSFLDDVLVVKRPLDTIFGYSSTCDPTILTGQLPREHGHFSFFAYDPQHSPFRGNLFLQLMRLVPKALSSRGRVRNIVNRIVRAQLGYSGYFNLYNMPFRLAKYFDYTEKRDIYQPGGINSGSPTVMDYFRENRIPFSLSDWRQQEESNLNMVKRDLERGEIACAYLYMAAMDAILHTYGKDHAAVDGKMSWYEEQIRRVLETAEASYRSVRLFVFSDHGMTDIIGACDLMKKIDGTGLELMEDYAAVYDSTMARFWFLKSDAEKKIRDVLEGAKEGHIMTAAEMHAYGCDFSDSRYGELFFLLNPGILLVPSHMGERPLAGMHGFAPEHEDSVASFSSSCRLEEQQYPKRLDDLYALMAEEGAAAASLNGKS